MCKLGGRDHNATSYSTETCLSTLCLASLTSRDHNATSYSTETKMVTWTLYRDRAEIITLRAIALKRGSGASGNAPTIGRDHNATSYSTETKAIGSMRGLSELQRS